MEDFANECPRFRILTAGKTGVGKTSLIKEVFKVEKIEASSGNAGVHDIDKEIYSSENERFVLHDSQGFEPGEIDNLKRVKNFIQKRTREKHIKDQLHAVWFCIQIPHTGGRLIETGDEEFLKIDFGDVPIIVVFTQCDRPIQYMRYQFRGDISKLNDEQKKQFIDKKTDAYFQKECIDILNKVTPHQRRISWVKVSTQKGYEHTVQELFNTTYSLIRNHVAESVWVVSAVAQRVDIDIKVDNSIRVGMSKYWRGLATSAHFPGNSLRDCLKLVHQDIIQTWNFLDPELILLEIEFRAMILQMVQDLADADATNPSSGLEP